MGNGSAAGIGHWLIAGLAWAALALLPGSLFAQYVLEDKDDFHRYDPGTVAIPLAYYSDAWRASGGVAGYLDGTFQRQADAYTFLLASSNGSYGGVFGMDNVQLLPVQRLFLDWTANYFRTQEDQNSVDGNGFSLAQAAGSNNSSKHKFISRASDDAVGNFTFKYLLPIGDGANRIIDCYCLDNGLLHSGSSGGQSFWNPADSGRTFLEITPRFEYLQIRSASARQHQFDTNVLQAGAVYDNTDFQVTPSAGNRTALSVSRDFGLFGSSGQWTGVSGEFAQFFGLGQSSLFRQQVLALDGWTSYTPTWHDSASGRPRSGASPFYDGAELGGAQRMRGFPEARYHDRAAIYGCAELRLIPYWNPLGEIPALKSSDIAWMQFVAFVEVGRVANEYTPEELFTHVKGDGGIGVRILTGDNLLRIDVAGSSEGVQIWANLNQAF